MRKIESQQAALRVVCPNLAVANIPLDNTDVPDEREWGGFSPDQGLPRHKLLSV